MCNLFSVVTYICLLPDIKVYCGLGNSDRLWQATSFCTRLLWKQENNNVTVFGYFYLMVHKTCYVGDSRTTVSSKLHLLLHLKACIHFPLTIAISASRASWMKWFRTLRSQIGLSGDGRPGRVHSNTINSKASSPANTDTADTKYSHSKVADNWAGNRKVSWSVLASMQQLWDRIWDPFNLYVFTWSNYCRTIQSNLREKTAHKLSALCLMVGAYFLAE